MSFSPKRVTLARAAAMPLFAALVVFGLFLVFGRAESAGSSDKVSHTGKWTCSMCPQFILPEPGKCPKCFMDLIPLQEGAASGGRLELVLTHDAADVAGIETAIAERADFGGRESVAVPATAVLRSLGRSFVYTASDDGEHLTYTLREIVPGKTSANVVEVFEGVDEGDEVVARGAFRIDSAMQIMGKTSLANLPPGDLADAEDDEPEPFMPAERSEVDLRATGLALDGWFRDYESLRAALAKDDADAAAGAARALRKEVTGAKAKVEGEFSELYGRLSTDVGALAEAGGLEAKRSAFEKVSGDMVLLARRYGAPAGGLNVVFCPMAFGGSGAHWAQPQETVDNPYHGLEMPLCGWQVDRIAGASE